MDALSTSEATPSTPWKSKKKRTFRVRDVPLEWDAIRLKSFLDEQYPLSNPEIKSFTVDIDSRSKTGTVVFKDDLKHHPIGQDWKISLPKPSDEQLQCTRDRYLVLEDSFLGTTPFFSPSPENHKIE